MFLMRFDMRAPSFGAPRHELYAAALEMAAYAETRGALVAVVCEHHRMEDGYLPSPLVMATALAARTTTLPIMTAALLLPLYDPVRLAEDMVVLDIISAGRVSYLMAIGYRPEEYEQHGVDFSARGRLAEEYLGVVLRAKTGDPFEYRGRRIQVTPPPHTPGGPTVLWGGGSRAAAARAGRFGLDFIAQGGPPDLADAYSEAARAAGHDPGACIIPPRHLATTQFVADDADRAWEELGPHLLHDAISYAAINPGDATTASISHARTVDELRAEGRTHVVVSVEEAVEQIRSGQPLQLQPLVGGLAPGVAWRYLRNVTDEVMARL
jgi:alkanesulfonate monooxygenase SsuD/methylene tetrahydromethanopterin reductase-like flavin-dependent oxidoreductase (luciferase family)